MCYSSRRVCSCRCEVVSQPNWTGIMQHNKLGWGVGALCPKCPSEETQWLTYFLRKMEKECSTCAPRRPLSDVGFFYWREDVCFFNVTWCFRFPLSSRLYPHVPLKLINLIIFSFIPLVFDMFHWSLLI